MNTSPQALFNVAALTNIEEAGSGVMILVEGLEKDELLNSRITRVEVSRKLSVLAECLEQLPTALHEAMPELAWDNWRAVSRQLRQVGQACDEALWFAVLSLVPATLMWLRTYRQNQPELFSLSA